MSEPPWLLHGHPGKVEFRQNCVGEQKGGLVGFVYIITDRAEGKQYVGKKLFWTRKTYQVKKRKKRRWVPSDWESYWGSNQGLLDSITKHGHELFDREILYLCLSKGECNYLEAKEQFERDVLLDEDYYNEWIAVKVHQAHLKGLRNKHLTKVLDQV